MDHTLFHKWLTKHTNRNHKYKISSGSWPQLSFLTQSSPGGTHLPKVQKSLREMCSKIFESVLQSLRVSDDMKSGAPCYPIRSLTSSGRAQDEFYSESIDGLLNLHVATWMSCSWYGCTTFDSHNGFTRDPQFNVHHIRVLFKSFELYDHHFLGVWIDWLYVCRVCFDLTSRRWCTVDICLQLSRAWLILSVWDPSHLNHTNPSHSLDRFIINNRNPWTNKNPSLWLNPRENTYLRDIYDHRDSSRQAKDVYGVSRGRIQITANVLVLSQGWLEEVPHSKSLYFLND
jgi:hypothetical protein